MPLVALAQSSRGSGTASAFFFLRSALSALTLRFLAGFPEDSLFHGREISERVHVRWGTFALVEATRALMRASLEDPLNQKFVLLSEAGIPLYPPDLVYVQLMSEDKSRINSCVVSGVRSHWLDPFPLRNIAVLAECFSSWHSSLQWDSIASSRSWRAVT